MEDFKSYNINPKKSQYTNNYFCVNLKMDQQTKDTCIFCKNN